MQSNKSSLSTCDIDELVVINFSLMIMFECCCFSIKWVDVENESDFFITEFLIWTSDYLYLLLVLVA